MQCALIIALYINTLLEILFTFEKEKKHDKIVAALDSIIHLDQGGAFPRLLFKICSHPEKRERQVEDNKGDQSALNSSD